LQRALRDVDWVQSQDIEQRLCPPYY
jgi:hypothetical protein